jgi:adenine nucleotide transporter 17
MLQTLSRIINRYGYSRLYAGLSADTLSNVVSTFLYFLIYVSLERAAHQWRKRRGAPQGGAAEASSEILIGTIAGIASKRLALPISAVCIRQQLGEEPESIGETLRKMRKESGVLGLFHIPLSAASLALLPSLTMYFHNAIVDSIHVKPSATTTFIVAAVSNALATIPLYPLMLAKSQSLSGHSRDRIGPYRRIIRTEGIAGLYKGIEAQLLKGLVQQGVMMAIKQRLVHAGLC